MANGRSPREVFQHHAEALGAEKLEEIVADYSDNAIFITPEGVLRGRDRRGLLGQRDLHHPGGSPPGQDGIRQAFTKLLADLPQAKWDLPTQIYEEDILLLEWSADSERTRVDDGIDTFVFRDGLIRVQTVRYTLQHKD